MFKPVTVAMLSAVCLLAQTNADTILLNGKIITMDAADSIAEALAIRSGKILEVGSKQSVMKHAGRATRMIDLQGRTATPGLIDTHLHFAGVDSVYSIDLSTAASIQEVQRLVGERAAHARRAPLYSCRRPGRRCAP
jgi:predicted amidohydrolase YtcJ